MKSFLFVVVLLVGGGAFYLSGGKVMVESYLNPEPLPETIEVEHATFMGDAQGNPYTK